MNSKTALAIAIVAAIATAPAYAKPKPIKGRYKCKGNATSSVDGGFPVVTKIKAKAFAFAYETQPINTIGIDVLTRGQQVSLIANVPLDYTPTFQLDVDRYDWGYKMDACACTIGSLYEHGIGTQNKNGRRVTLDITQTWNEWKNPSIHSDRYILTCKR